jgi:methyl-accepting chemotaxis protein
MADQDEVANSMADLLKIQPADVEAMLIAHSDWKRRLRDAVSRGFCELDSDEVGRDDLCELGRWLHSLPPEYGTDSWCEDVVEAHARFHREAALVVNLIETGRTDEARAAMDSETEFARTSEELVGFLEMWRDAA